MREFAQQDKFATTDRQKTETYVCELVRDRVFVWVVQVAGTN